VSRPTPEELRRRLIERLASEPQRGQTMTQAGTPAPVETVADVVAPVLSELPVVASTVAETPVVVEPASVEIPTAAEAVLTPVAPVPVAEVRAETPVVAASVPTPPNEPKPKPASRPRAILDTADADAPSLRAQKPIIRRNDEGGRLRSHPVAEALYLDIARTKLRAKRGQKLTWDSILQQGLDLVLARPSQMESLLNEVDMLTSKARRTIAATISIDHDIGMQELLFDRPSIGSTRPRLKLEDIWCAALIAWKRSIL
jgi:hypothetical protein